MNPSLSLQEQYANKSICFGCGPQNPKGLKIKSYVTNEGVKAEFITESYMQAFPNVINGGIIGTLLDCHSNWTASWSIMQDQIKNGNNLTEPPCTVTADFHVTLKRPTPAHIPLHLIAHATSVTGNRAHVYAELWANDKLCATCEGSFVAVTEGHPAFHRW